MKTTLIDREFDKFRDGKSGDAVAIVYDGDSLPVETSGVEWDEIVVTFPSSTQDLFTYKKNSLTVQTVLVEYSSTDKKTIIYMQKTRF
jgi:hypothetical protein